MGQCLVRVRGSNNVLHVVQTNQTFFIKLGNKRIVLRCLTEINLRKTSSIIVIHASQTSETFLLVWTDLQVSNQLNHGNSFHREPSQPTTGIGNREARENINNFPVLKVLATTTTTTITTTTKQSRKVYTKKLLPFHGKICVKIYSYQITSHALSPLCLSPLNTRK